ncbi:MAG: hypothetical protein IPL95_11395 [Saprospiraceae bacterium]|nr:hypothetical protein [Saprospiraceae bacterium]
MRLIICFLLLLFYNTLIAQSKKSIYLNISYGLSGNKNVYYFNGLSELGCDRYFNSHRKSLTTGIGYNLPIGSNFSFDGNVIFGLTGFKRILKNVDTLVSKKEYSVLSLMTSLSAMCKIIKVDKVAICLKGGITLYHPLKVYLEEADGRTNSEKLIINNNFFEYSKINFLLNTGVSFLVNNYRFSMIYCFVPTFENSFFDKRNLFNNLQLELSYRIY